MIDFEEFEKAISKTLGEIHGDIEQVLTLAKSVRVVGVQDTKSDAVERLVAAKAALSTVVKKNDDGACFDIGQLKMAIIQELGRVIVDVSDDDVSRVLEIGKNPTTPEQLEELQAIYEKVLPSPFLDNLDFAPLISEFFDLSGSALIGTYSAAFNTKKG
jgi:hypothetical protein